MAEKARKYFSEFERAWLDVLVSISFADILMKVVASRENQLMDAKHENGKFIQEKCFMLRRGFHFNSRHLVTLRLMDFFLL